MPGTAAPTGETGAPMKEAALHTTKEEEDPMHKETQEVATQQAEVTRVT